MNQEVLNKFLDSCNQLCDYIYRIKAEGFYEELREDIIPFMQRFARVYHLIIVDSIQTQKRLPEKIEEAMIYTAFNVSEEANNLGIHDLQAYIIEDVKLYIYNFFPEIDIETLDLEDFCQRGKTRYS